MEDYPRGSTVNKNYETHLDFQSIRVHYAEKLASQASKLGVDPSPYLTDAECYRNKLE